MPTSSLGHTAAGGGKSPELIRKHEERLTKLAVTIERGKAHQPLFADGNKAIYPVTLFADTEMYKVVYLGNQVLLATNLETALNRYKSL